MPQFYLNKAIADARALGFKKNGFANKSGNESSDWPFTVKRVFKSYCLPLSRMVQLFMSSTYSGDLWI